MSHGGGGARPAQGRLYRAMLPDRNGETGGDDEFGFGDLLDSEEYTVMIAALGVTQDPILKLSAAVSRYGGTSALVALYSAVRNDRTRSARPRHRAVTVPGIAAIGVMAECTHAPVRLLCCVPWRCAALLWTTLKTLNVNRAVC